MGRGPVGWRWGRERANRTGGILQDLAPPFWHLRSWEAWGALSWRRAQPQFSPETREQRLGAVGGGVQ